MIFASVLIRLHQAIAYRLPRTSKALAYSPDRDRRDRDTPRVRPAPSIHPVLSIHPALSDRPVLAQAPKRSR
jgi:hypothetical protein